MENIQIRVLGRLMKKHYPTYKNVLLISENANNEVILFVDFSEFVRFFEFFDRVGLEGMSRLCGSLGWVRGSGSISVLRSYAT